MAKEKVYKLAQEFKVSSEALVQMLRGMGISVKSHMSTVDDSLREEIKKRFEQERAEIKKQYELKKQIYINKSKEEIAAKAVSPTSVTPAPVESEKAPLKPAEPESSSAVSHIIKPSKPKTTQLPETTFTPSQRGFTQAASEKGKISTVTTRFTSELPATQEHDYHDSDRHKDKVKKKSGKKRFEKTELDELQLKEMVKKTLAKIGSGAAKRKHKKEALKKEATPEEGKKILNVSEFVTVNELANLVGRNVSEVIAKCLELGLFVTINQRLDFETIELLADEFGFTAKLMNEYSSEEEQEETDDPQALKPRAPVVTVMGHVDHGKTSLLDYIRKTNVIAGEAGGITQHIAAYEVKTKHGPVTFLDTPGHEAFTAMRARGSLITDVIVLVVAADSGVMPQTKEAIDHARAANVPIVVAINKMDLPIANPDKVKAELAQYGVMVEGWGGNVSCVEISAKTGNGVDKLLETLALETELMDLKANPNGKAKGVVIEAELDKGKGPIATVLIRKGTLKKGDPFITGIHFGKVRELFNERGISIDEAGPSRPVVVLGLSGTPQAGDSFTVVEDEKQAREISARRRLAQKERELRRMGSFSLDHLYEQIKAGDVRTLNLIVKGDVDGSVEALATSLEKLSTAEIKVNVIHRSVGAIKESDIMLAAASKAIIIGFHLSPNTKIRELAKKEGVDIRTYRIIYEAVDEVKKAMEGMLRPEIKENVIAVLEVRKVFQIAKIGNVAGCYVVSGTVRRGAKARLIRNDVELTDSKISSLRRHKEDVREVVAGLECGVALDNFINFQIGDRIEVYEEIQVARKLVMSSPINS